MARSYFHFSWRGVISLADKNGTDLPDLSAAHAHALALIRKTLRLFADDREARGWSIDIAGCGENVLSVLFPPKQFTRFVAERPMRPQQSD